MSTGYGRPCPKCDKAPLLRFGTDGNGRMTEEVIEACPCVRKQMRVCRDCPASIAHLSPRFSLCPRCARASARRVCRASRERNIERVRKQDREHKREVRQRDMADTKARRKERYAREAARLSVERKKARRWNNPKYQRTLANNRAWAARNRESINQKQRAYRARKKAERAEAAALSAPPVEHQFKTAA